MNKQDEIIMAVNALRNFKAQFNHTHPVENQISELFREVETVAHLAGESINKLLELQNARK